MGGRCCTGTVYAVRNEIHASRASYSSAASLLGFAFHSKRGGIATRAQGAEYTSGSEEATLESVFCYSSGRVRQRTDDYMSPQVE